MSEAEYRAQQAKVLFAIAARIERGEALLSSDTFQDVEEDLELRIDEAAIAEAWSIEPEPPVSKHGSSDPGPRSSTTSISPTEIRVFKRAEHDLLALSDAERASVKQRLEDLERDMLPRGTTAIPSPRGVHLRLRAGAHRVLYRVRKGALVVV